MYNILFFILLFSSLLISFAQITIQSKETHVSLNNVVFDNGSNHIVAMVKDYTLIDMPVSYSNVLNIHSFSLKQYKDKDKELINHQKLKNLNNNWFADIKQLFNKLTKEDLELELEPFEVRVQNHVDSLNRIIINASDSLLNMCDKMIEKTTSSLPLSYSSYVQFETEMRAKDSESVVSNSESDSDKESDSDGRSFFSFFSSSSKTVPSQALVITDLDKDKAEIETEVRQKMYAYQQYRLALNNRQTFLNSLCFNTFGDPYTIYYNSANNTLNVAYNAAPIRFYAIIVQNIIDNSYVRNLNRGFKDQTKDQKKNKDKNQFNFDVDFDIDKEKKEILVEKAKYILPILQKLDQRLPTYLSDVAKRSLNIDEYFQNLRWFWIDILDESVIGAQDSPEKYKLELERLRHKADLELKRRLKEEQIERDMILNAEKEAQRIKDEYRKQSLIDEAHDFVRQEKILFNERQQNFSDKEWQQFNTWFSYQLTKGVNVYDSLLGGVGKMIYSTFDIPANIILNFASSKVSEIGKLFILVAGVVIVGLMTLFFVKLFVRRFIRLFWNTEKTEKTE
jgi:hypothetical protein